MSKIGKKPIPVPKGVDVQINDGLISVKGPKGELKKKISGSVSASVSNGSVMIKPVSGQAVIDNASWGLFRALIQNMIKGVTDGFEKVLEFEGIGYKANVKGNDLELNLGYSHPIMVKAPEGVTFKVEKSVIKISGIDNELIGHVAAGIRSKREPEPYKGSGIRYQGEVIKKKAGKKAVAAG
ncbi:MAG: 50S ribosomal protein L6 [Candidatus Yanofskybacteria bacterium RIFCSPHIGHO2_02_FULL_44_12b]|uniref:Large ribosomal subunit protein uL6 n=2 Tax=Candidatus Yanofskyibacteriota TaxID=1752733 RepID=A0A1F8GIJ9_9BACT|nr:MAG: 50S ribosomal protein L6 [Candidatus Yanofskybacteria bacterium GW2011_GWA2_44_9]OGN04814.1 MAG: 50S ribosomal protein L6 [Candidatus Yanofskybacteria bacterium RIFCSPHIGHO2_01_FULL_44_24]OGN16061.1 MAG: 50S ribosomal protein L6 [Candidatus Yanofskybacteria bacterium RIFCSPHIGHO2_02_FULL_44_12b]OGN25131.1 MAG: 50S ribosomal protein L6 [Candidatus Yanofskybacteria bacterium RIFCSPLOWO2_01_FULL_44_22]